MNPVQEWMALDCTHQQERAAMFAVHATKLLNRGFLLAAANSQRAAQYRYEVARERYRMLEEKQK